MSEPRPTPESPARPAPTLAGEVGAKARRKLRARRQGVPGVWSGLGMMGLVGWSVVVPTLLGAALGIWLDRHHPGRHSWALALLVAGLVLGCFNAWRWVAREDQAMRRDAEEQDEHDADA
ncbi:AtpZ/AtpI family protein [Cupriavidus sp. 30B13]|uniref:AtpZ/AtpI family protein n=1 Tax=Cupriavidus sp. 30B13 TaxID=3384241 RepID=UPI003B908967